jgi:hypothetical protein
MILYAVILTDHVPLQLSLAFLYKEFTVRVWAGRVSTGTKEAGRPYQKTQNTGQR